MTEDLVLPVPDTLPAMYLVPVSMPEPQAQRTAIAAVAAQVAEPLRSLTIRLLAVSAVMVAPRTASDLTPVHALQPAADDVPPEQARAAGEATEFIAFAALLPPRPGPVHEWATRAAAAAFAAELGAPVVDGFLRRVCTADAALASLPGAPELADVRGGFRLSDWVVVRQEGHILLTHGLGRFGLPELRVSDVPPELKPHWILALHGLGHRLLELLRCELRRSGETAFFRIPARLRISRTDVGNAYGLDLHGDAGLPVQLSLDPALTDAQDSYLTLDAPDDAPAAAHRMALQEALFAPAKTLLFRTRS
jgi:hypothetical protein